MNNILIPGRVVVCAALRCPYGIVCGARHYDQLMIGQVRYWTEKYDLKKSDWEQGFVDQNGVFMDRFEALSVAVEAQQINTRRRKTQPENRLFSEDLY